MASTEKRRALMIRCHIAFYSEGTSPGRPAVAAARVKKKQRGRGCLASPGTAKRACCARALLLRGDGIASCAWRAPLAPQPQKRGNPPSRTVAAIDGAMCAIVEIIHCCKRTAPVVALLAQVTALHAWASSLGLSHPESNMFTNPKVR